MQIEQAQIRSAIHGHRLRRRIGWALLAVLGYLGFCDLWMLGHTTSQHGGDRFPPLPYPALTHPSPSAQFLVILIVFTLLTVNMLTNTHRTWLSEHVKGVIAVTGLAKKGAACGGMLCSTNGAFVVRHRGGPYQLSRRDLFALVPGFLENLRDEQHWDGRRICVLRSNSRTTLKRVAGNCTVNGYNWSSLWAAVTFETTTITPAAIEALINYLGSLEASSIRAVLVNLIGSDVRVAWDKGKGNIRYADEDLQATADACARKLTPFLATGCFSKVSVTLNFVAQRDGQAKNMTVVSTEQASITTSQTDTAVEAVPAT